MTLPRKLGGGGGADAKCLVEFAYPYTHVVRKLCPPKQWARGVSYIISSPSMNATFQPAPMLFFHQNPQQEFSAQYFISSIPSPIATAGTRQSVCPSERQVL